MKILAISDLHGYLPPIDPCDVLVLCGDIVPATSHKLAFQEKWLGTKFRDWLDAIPATQVVAIAGNHDAIFQVAPERVPTLPWHYLQDSSIEIKGVKFFGVPWTREFFDWHFMATEEELAKKFDAVPFDTNILVTHGPPFGYLDVEGYGYTHVGSTSLEAWIEKVRPDHVICGHIHGNYGQVEVGRTTVSNVAAVDERYRLVNGPMEIIL